MQGLVASGEGDGLQRGVGLLVVATWVNGEREGRDLGQGNGVVLDLSGGAAGAEGELLANDLTLLATGDDRDGELLGALGAGLAEFETDTAEGARLIEFKVDGLRAGVSGVPAFGFLAAEGVF